MKLSASKFTRALPICRYLSQPGCAGSTLTDSSSRLRLVSFKRFVGNEWDGAVGQNLVAPWVGGHLFETIATFRKVFDEFCISQGRMGLQMICLNVTSLTSLVRRFFDRVSVDGADGLNRL